MASPGALRSYASECSSLLLPLALFTIDPSTTVSHPLPLTMNQIAFVFPGQGSQAVGMLNGFAGNHVVADTLAEASDALKIDLGKMIAEGPKEDLDLTTNTQPVMLASAVAFYRAWIAARRP